MTRSYGTEGTLTMYTVIRFDFSDNRNELKVVGEKLNTIVPGAFNGEDRVKHRFSCSVSKSTDWSTHCQEILVWLARASSLIREVSDMGVRIEVNCDVERVGRENVVMTSYMMSDELIAMLAELHLSFVFSV